MVPASRTARLFGGFSGLGLSPPSDLPAMLAWPTLLVMAMLFGGFSGFGLSPPSDLPAMADLPIAALLLVISFAGGLGLMLAGFSLAAKVAAGSVNKAAEIRGTSHLRMMFSFVVKIANLISRKNCAIPI